MRGRILALGVLGVGLTCGLPAIRAETIILRNGLDGYTGTVDLYITRTSPNTNYSNLSYSGRLVVDIWGSPFPPDYVTTQSGPSWNEGLLKFEDPFASIPPGSRITSATLSLYIINPWEKPDMRRVITPWTAANASWNHFDGDGVGTDNGDHPNQGGGLTPGVNVSVVDFSSTSAANPGWLSIDVTDAVQQWYANPSSNYGWAFFQNNDPNRGMFVSAEDTVDPTHRPTLTITYVVPEPTSFWLFVLAFAGWATAAWPPRR